MSDTPALPIPYGTPWSLGVRCDGQDCDTSFEVESGCDVVQQHDQQEQDAASTRARCRVAPVSRHGLAVRMRGGESGFPAVARKAPAGITVRSRPRASPSLLL